MVACFGNFYIHTKEFSNQAKLNWCDCGLPLASGANSLVDRIIFDQLYRALDIRTYIGILEVLNL